jgi:hypothetical protein
MQLAIRSIGSYYKFIILVVELTGDTGISEFHTGEVAQHRILISMVHGKIMMRSPPQLHLLIMTLRT